MRHATPGGGLNIQGGSARQRKQLHAAYSEYTLHAACCMLTTFSVACCVHSRKYAPMTDTIQNKNKYICTNDHLLVIDN
jgi:hypothetical protein